MSQHRYSVDVCSCEVLSGWAFHPSGLAEIRVSIAGQLVGRATLGLSRDDVAAAHPGVEGAARSGFGFLFPPEAFGALPATVTLVLRAQNGEEELVKQRGIVPLRARADAFEGLPAEGRRAPLPLDVVRCLEGIHPDWVESPDGWDDRRVAVALGDVRRIAEQRTPAKPVQRWVHFLRAMLVSFRHIREHYGRFNTRVAPDAKDWDAVASTAEEMLSIANTLYVLRSYGLEGRFVECGCFKGYSTCCLSQACAWLRLEMDVFDSFEGLPHAEGDAWYKAGDFRGDFEEVLDNLRTFGRPDLIRFHRGFFADTVPHYRDPVFALWMDVDLPSSAADVMAFLPLLDPRAPVISHECPEEAFLNGVFAPEKSDVLPPIVDAFLAAGRDPAGVHLFNYTGAVFDFDSGIPLLSWSELKTVAEP